MAKIKDITGQKFGKLTALAYAGNTKWSCKCDCGEMCEVLGDSLRRGSTKSCGCSRNVRHGATINGAWTPEYNSWVSMNDRCNNPNNKRFYDYGGKGISICERWKLFENFLADMGPRPKGTTIDRWPNPNGNYEPNNCRWGTTEQQAYNKKNTTFVELNGAKMTIKESAAITGAKTHTIRTRLIRGWSPEKAILAPVMPNHRTIVVDGKSVLLKQAAEISGIPATTLRCRLRRGWTPEMAAFTPMRKYPRLPEP